MELVDNSSSILHYASEADIDAIYKSHQREKNTLRSSTIKYRLNLIRSIEVYLRDPKMIKQLTNAVQLDFNKHPSETELTEIIPTISHIKEIKSKLKGWLTPKRNYIPLVHLGLSAQTVYEPKGATLIISPWNYPFFLAVYPMLYAIAAGCTVVLKPSEMTKHTSKFLEKMVKACLPEDQYTVVHGGIPETTYLLNKKWDHIFFTGSPAVGKIVMQAASKNLTSVSLELGGKSPCVVDETVSIKSTASKLAWGKLINAGQTCIAPDYVLVHKSKQAELVNELKQSIEKMYGDDPSSSTSFARIITKKHAQRQGNLIQDALEKGATLAYGGTYDVASQYVEPTILTNVTMDMQIMQEEIFGPLLPILAYEEKQETLDIIHSFDKPLSFYLCTSSKQTMKYYTEHTSSGGMVINEFILGAAIPSVPFGGVNHSGIGKAFGFHGLIEFSNEKPVVKRNFMTISFAYPPYTDAKAKLMKWIKRFV